MPLALSLSPHPDLYQDGSEWAVGNSNSAKLIHFLKNAHYLCDFLPEILHVLQHTATSRHKINTDFGILQAVGWFILVQVCEK